MIALFRNRLAYLGLSLLLLLASFPLVSVGTTRGSVPIWGLGLLALCAGGMIPPVQRLLFGPPPGPGSGGKEESVIPSSGGKEE